MNFRKKLTAAFVVVAMLSVATVAGATYGSRTQGAGARAGLLNCPGGMDRLGHVMAEDMTIFDFDPAVNIDIEYTVADDFFLVEDIDTGSHAGTHLDVPAHFFEEGRTVDQLEAEEFVWPAYKMDVRGMTFANDQIEIDDILAYEEEHGKIRKDGQLFIVQTGAEAFWGAEVVAVDADGNAANEDDFFDVFQTPGLSATAINWLFSDRNIDGVGTDSYGPDAHTDGDFAATSATLENGGIALVALANLDTVNTRGDIIIASTVALENGSGFSTDPLACHGNPPSGNGGWFWWWGNW